MRRCGVRWSPHKARDPFATLGLRPSASKDDVKKAYRNLAKELHPDAGTSADPVRMEQVNRAYNLLLKEGMFEQLHRPAQGQAATAGAGAAGRTGPDAFDQWSQSVTEGAAEGELGLLDPDTERVTPNGRYMYQHRNTGQWHAVDAPIGRPDVPRYKGFAEEAQRRRSADLFEEIRNKADAAAAADGSQREKRRRSRYHRWRFIHEDSIPFDGPIVATLLFFTWLFCMYACYYRLHNKRLIFYGRKGYWEEIREHKEEVRAQYDAFAPELDAAAAAAVVMFIAAARKVDPDASPVPPTASDMQGKPPGFFHLVWTTN